jgi:hypothetical protein
MEIWKDIEGYEGYYQVSNLGRVKGLKRTANKKNGVRLVQEKMLSFGKLKRGYPCVVLSKKGIKKSYLVHRIVCQTFKPIKNFLEVNHINAIVNDNRIENLEWVTGLENKRHAKELGINPKGETHGRVKLTKEQALLIKYSHKDMMQKDIAKLYNIKPSQVSRIRKGTKWSHI